jgi:hypothetical protein
VWQASLPADLRTLPVALTDGRGPPAAAPLPPSDPRCAVAADTDRRCGASCESAAGGGGGGGGGGPDAAAAAAGACGIELIELPAGAAGATMLGRADGTFGGLVGSARAPPLACTSVKSSECKNASRVRS